MTNNSPSLKKTPEEVSSCWMVVEKKAKKNTPRVGQGYLKDGMLPQRLYILNVFVSLRYVTQFFKNIINLWRKQKSLPTLS